MYDTNSNGYKSIFALGTIQNNMKLFRLYLAT